jgi:hypothetical protein
MLKIVQNYLKMMGPKTGENMKCETSVDVSKYKTTHEQADRRMKRKIFCDSMDNQNQTSCSKRRRTKGCVNTKNSSLQTGIEPIVLNGNCEIQYGHINDTKNDCYTDLSWLINFNAGALFKTVEIDDHNRKRRKYEEIACPGMC